MNNLTDLDDPLGTPSIDPTVVRQRAHVLRRGRSGRRFVGVAGGVAVVAFAASLARPDTAQLEVGSGVDSGQPIVDLSTAVPPTECAPMTTVSRSFLVMSGSTPADNDTLVRALIEILSDEEFAAELHSNLDAELAARVSSDEVFATLSASRKPESAAIDVDVMAPNEADAEQISAAVAPTLNAILQTQQQDLPPENQIPGPIFQELFARPTVTQVPC